MEKKGRKSTEPERIYQGEQTRTCMYDRQIEHIVLITTNDQTRIAILPNGVQIVTLLTTSSTSIRQTQNGKTLVSTCEIRQLFSTASNSSASTTYDIPQSTESMRSPRMKYITMTYINKTNNKCGPFGIHYIATFFRTPKPRWFIMLTTFLVFVTIFHHVHSFSRRKFGSLFSDDDYDSIMADGSDDIAGDDLTTTTPVPGSEVLIDIMDRSPNFKLATKSGERPSTDNNRGYGRLLDELRLQEVCQQDSSTTVVDVGAGIGEFGLYAAACGCTVYMFELQPNKVTLIRSSINHNSFTSQPVNIFQNAVSDLPADSLMTYTPPEGSTGDAVSAQTVRLDEISWSTSSIYVLKVSTEGSEMSVLRSAKSLFAQKRIKYLYFDFSPWLGEQEPQKNLLPYVRRELKARFMYSLYPTDHRIFGPIAPLHFQTIFDRAAKSRKETGIYAVFDAKVTKSSVQSEAFQGLQR